MSPDSSVDVEVPVEVDVLRARLYCSPEIDQIPLRLPSYSVVSAAFLSLLPHLLH